MKRLADLSRVDLLEAYAGFRQPRIHSVQDLRHYEGEECSELAAALQCLNPAMRHVRQIVRELEQPGTVGL